MFTFDDLIKLDAGSAQTLMRHIDKDKLAVALKGATEPVREFFLSNMSTRAAKMLLDDMQALGPVRLRDVDEAQGQLVNLAKDLAAKGEIMISKSRGDEGAGLLIADEQHRPQIPVRPRLRGPPRRQADDRAGRARSAALTDAEAAGLSPRLCSRRRPRRTADAEQRAAAALERIADALDAARARRCRQSRRGWRPRRSRSRSRSAGKLAPALIAREPFAEISALARDCFRHLVAAPHVVVRVNEAQHAARNAPSSRTSSATARLRGPPRRARRTRHRARRLPHRMGRRRRHPRPGRHRGGHR